jgi:hypothetical protein
MRYTAEWNGQLPRRDKIAPKVIGAGWIMSLTAS